MLDHFGQNRHIIEQDTYELQNRNDFKFVQAFFELGNFAQIIFIILGLNSSNG